MGRQKQTHCIRGHERTPANMTKKGGCKECGQLRYKAKKLLSIPKSPTNCCKNGHERTPDILYKNGNCKKCSQLNYLKKVMNVTSVEDILKTSTKYIPQTHCIRGHERTPDNIEKAGGCKECNKLHGKARRLLRIPKSLKVVEPKPAKVKKSKAPKTHCKHGHERTPENIYKDGGCKLCASERQKVYLQNPENKARQAANMKAYQQTEKRQAYLKSEHGKKLEKIRTKRKRIKRVAKHIGWITSDVWKIAA